jgi:hypothetical protein
MELPMHGEVEVSPARNQNAPFAASAGMTLIDVRACRQVACELYISSVS